MLPAQKFNLQERTRVFASAAGYYFVCQLTDRWAIQINELLPNGNILCFRGGI